MGRLSPSQTASVGETFNPTCEGTFAPIIARVTMAHIACSSRGPNLSAMLGSGARKVWPFDFSQLSCAGPRPAIGERVLAPRGGLVKGSQIPFRRVLLHPPDCCLEGELLACDLRRGQLRVLST
jgi:hypothetical protein